ncbi:uncharacterized protein CMU_018470 [Cryptosporidium muris RN66]|uniref:Nucleolar complex-associated protein 3 N-terminal domain-containing protein n=1 Tax=Cryptosporidium muris (strain RN66) TaxID=441375 RepID=B6AD86_CRYMR|nr:uncharacterized protein CMU_018470 [Cryptosporidium muris RN66]EEA06090.1 hypothetical protein, conserved [Cryptosporidium muris RN66]|eukprot:XP_002140439.1 hypothetical protein [Cryptosporidium muris RN66]
MELEDIYELKRSLKSFNRWSELAEKKSRLPIFTRDSGWTTPKRDLAKINKNSSLTKTKTRRLELLEKKYVLNKVDTNYNTYSANKLENKVNQTDFDSHTSTIKTPRDIAVLCQTVMAHPEENIALLECLLSFCEANRIKVNGDLTELAILSLTLVIRDIVPGYKISEHIMNLSITKTDNVMISKDLQKIQSFERKIVNIYKRTCLLLCKILKSVHYKFINKRSIVKASADLLEFTFHFNYHVILLRWLILYLMSKHKEINNTYIEYCSDCFANILTSDINLQIGVEALEIIHQVLFLDIKSKKSLKYKLTCWILKPFTKYSPWVRIQESKTEMVRLFGKNSSSINKDISEELQQTNSTRDNIEVLKKREEIILTKLFALYAKVLIIDGEDLEYIYLGISHYCHRINEKLTSELIELIKNKLFNENSFTITWVNFFVIMRTAVILLKNLVKSNEELERDQSWIIRSLLTRIKESETFLNKIYKSHNKLKSNLNNKTHSIDVRENNLHKNEVFISNISILGYNISDSNKYNQIINTFQSNDLIHLIIQISTICRTNINYLYVLLLYLINISWFLSILGNSIASCNLMFIVAQLIIKFPKLKILLDPEGISCNEFPLDNGFTSNLNYQEISICNLLVQFIESQACDTVKFASASLLTESPDEKVRNNAISFLRSSIKGINQSNVGNITPSYYILKFINQMRNSKENILN